MPSQRRSLQHFQPSQAPLVPRLGSRSLSGFRRRRAFSWMHRSDRARSWPARVRRSRWCRAVQRIAHARDHDRTSPRHRRPSGLAAMVTSARNDIRPDESLLFQPAPRLAPQWLSPMVRDGLPSAQGAVLRARRYCRPPPLGLPWDFTAASGPPRGHQCTPRCQHAARRTRPIRRRSMSHRREPGSHGTGTRCDISWLEGRA